MRSSENILTDGKNICTFAGACATSDCCAGVLGPVLPVGRLGHLLLPVAGVVAVLSVAPPRPDHLADRVADCRSWNQELVGEPK